MTSVIRLHARYYLAASCGELYRGIRFSPGSEKWRLVAAYRRNRATAFGRSVIDSQYKIPHQQRFFLADLLLP